MERNFLSFVSFKSGMKKLVFVAIISVSTLFTANASSHLPTDKNDIAAVTSLGASDGTMAFNLKYENADEDRMVIMLSDREGMVLYKEILSAKSIDKTFKTTSDVGTVVLSITNLKDKTTQKFSISNEKRIVEEVSITNLVK